MLIGGPSLADLEFEYEEEDIAAFFYWRVYANVY